MAMLPPRISFHQEGNLEDWSESLFSVLGKGKRSSVLMGGDATSSKKEKRITMRPISRFSMAGESGSATTMAPSSLSKETAVPSPPDTSFGANLTLGSRTRPTIDAVEEGGDEQHAEEDQAEKTTDDPEHDGEQVVDNDTTRTAEGDEGRKGSSGAPSTPLLPDVSLGPNVPFPGKDLESPVPTSSSPPASPRRASIDSLPPSPPPKPKPKPAPLALPTTTTLAPPRTNIITGISGRSPVNSLFGIKPHPLPIPISPSQIRAQLRPAPPRSPHLSPTLPLPPLKRIPSQPNLQPPVPPSQLPLIPSPRKAVKHDPSAPQASTSESRRNSSQTLQPARTSPGDRDSGMSTITVTPATITTAKTEVVRTAIASVIDSDTVSLASRRESVLSTADAEPQTVTYDGPDIGRESPNSQEAPDDSLVSETSSVSLLHDGPQSKWPAPPPPPVELETDSTPRRISRFRTTSLRRVSQMQALGSTMVSPIDTHFPHGSSDTMSSSSSESAPLTTPNGISEVSPSTVPKARSSLPPEAKLLSSRSNTFGGVDMEDGSGDEECEARSLPSEAPLSESHAPIPPAMHPLLAQLQQYITPRNPVSCLTNLVEIAEGESGSVFVARVASSFTESRPQGQQTSTERPIPPGTSHVAIKRIPLPPLSFSPSLSDDSPVSNKLVSVSHELSLLKDLDHEHLLLLDALYVGPNSTEAEDTEPASAVDSSLWIRMELMERSLADVIGLAAEGLALQERLVGRFASDVSACYLLLAFSEKY